jgi:predicted dehydrogenase/threonine dehydrogenase-like Zn-dependent dehydrogenase
VKQLFQDPKAGAVEVAEVPEPALKRGCILVRNAFSVVSPGTERSTVKASQGNYLQMARNRPDLVRRVLDMAKRDGVLETWSKVQRKLSELKALGYASAGEVVAVGEGAKGLFEIGDRVACAGQDIASHAELVCVPTNLAVKVPEGVKLDEAAFATIGAIALHGVRQLEPRLGDRVAVIGLGLVGLLTAQLLRASGARVIAFDLDERLVALAGELGAEEAHCGGTDDQVRLALQWTEGVGVDGVIVAASASSDAPMVAAAGMARDRARVVATGLVPYGLPREVAYPKELELRISRSYGPGRYDGAYEQGGIGYPIGYVPWTETRNLEAFLYAVASGGVQITPLLTGRYAIEDGPAAYASLLEEGALNVGVVLEYPRASASAGRATLGKSSPRIQGRVGVSFVGAGAFARGTLLPAFQKHAHADLRCVVTTRGLTALDAHRNFGFDRYGTELDEAFGEDVDLVCIATRHDLHARMVVRALEAGKHVFVEKPLALTTEELDEVEAALSRSEGQLLVGFNRRFAPMATAAREVLKGRGPVHTVLRVNAGPLHGHWLTDPKVGGGRLVGEGCHFVDLASFLAGDAAIVSAHGAHANGEAPQDSSVLLGFEDGSTAVILYTAGGAEGVGKEWIEAHAGGATVCIDNWVSGTATVGTRSRKLKGRGKGHAEEIDALVTALRGGAPSPIAPQTLLGVSRATLQAAGRA